MTPELEVVWSGALERAGQADGLSSPYLHSAAALCMSEGTPDPFEGPPRVARKIGTCFSCRGKFERLGMARVCPSCFDRIHRAQVWR